MESQAWRELCKVAVTRGSPVLPRNRAHIVREMILAEDEKARRAALAKLLPMQRADFVELFKIMGGMPVTIRLLDPPLGGVSLHQGGREIAHAARSAGIACYC
jgi:pyruvate, orthophosphate dikinase